MSDSPSIDPTQNPAPSDPLPVPMVLVQLVATTVRRGRNTYPVAAGTVLQLMTLPAIHTYSPPVGTALIPAGTYTLGSIVPPSALPAPTTIPLAAFIARAPAGVFASICADPAMVPWVQQIMSYPVIDVTNSTLISDMAAIVAAGHMTAAQSATMLNLAIPSP